MTNRDSRRALCADHMPVGAADTDYVQTTKANCEAHSLTTRRIIIEPHPDGLLALEMGTGEVARFSDPQRAVDAIAASDRATRDKTGTTMASIIEWRGMPAGFVAPEPRP